MSVRRVMWATAGVAAVLTAFVTAAPFAHFAYRNPRLHLVLETAMSLVAFLCAYLLYGRLQRGGQLRDALLASALVVHGLTTLLLSVAPAITGGPEHPDALQTWAPQALRLLGTVIFVTAAFVPDWKLRRPHAFTLRVLVVVAFVASAIVASVAAFESQLPLAVDQDLSPTGPVRPLIAAHPVMWMAQLVSAALFGAAAVGFARVATRRGDELFEWIAIASVLAAFARINFFLFPSLYSDWVYTGDLLRLAFYLVLLAGAAREIERYWRETATLDERRRVGRELHDGLAQDLAFIAAQSQNVARGELDPRLLAELSRAGARALDESRRAIAALTLPLDERLDVAVARAVEEVAAREGVGVRLQLADVEVPATVRETLVRIAREAVTNAARHARANSISVELTDGAVPVLRVADDGVGFDPDEGRAAGYGLDNIRERADQIGAALRINSRHGRGTEIEVEIR